MKPAHLLGIVAAALALAVTGLCFQLASLSKRHEEEAALQLHNAREERRAFEKKIASLEAANRELGAQAGALESKLSEQKAREEARKAEEARRLARAAPDLVVTDLTYKFPYVYVHYSNQGKGWRPGDFLIKLSAGGKSFKGNKFYRFKVPRPGEVKRTGGFTPGLIGLSKGDEKIITAEIDWERRVAESNEANNVFHKQLRLSEGPKKPPQPAEPDVF